VGHLAVAAPGFRAPARTPRAAERLDGFGRLRLEHLLYDLIRGGELPEPEWPALARTVAEALVYLRRTGRERYAGRQHRAFAAVPAPVSEAGAGPPSGVGVLCLGENVHILGEPHTGSIVYLVIAREPWDPCPAPWYVALCEELRLCRAHGADELEPLLTAPPAFDPRLPGPMPE